MIIRVDEQMQEELKKIMGLAEVHDPAVVLKRALSLYRELLVESGLGKKIVVIGEEEVEVIL